MQEFRYSGHGDALPQLLASNRPMVIRGLVADWPIVAAARQSDRAFATMLAGWDNGTAVDALVMPPEAEGIVGYSADGSHFNFSHQRASVTQGLHKLLQLPESDGTGVALQSAPVERCVPGFLEQHAVPWLSDGIKPRIWLGNRVTTPAHFDEYHNIACVACGARRFTVFPPDQVGNLYIGPLDYAPTGAAISMARLDRPDDPRFPRLREALEHALVADLEPGDAIYMPPMWWHHVASLKKLNALVNYWWKQEQGSGLVPNTRIGGLLHAILLYKSLPPAERKAWRVLFEHYVFSDEDPAAHIPAERRGWLGELDVEQSGKLLEAIRRYL
ncbi:MAG TPA: cupin-like domain-containing protein [Dyella sp.]